MKYLLSLFLTALILSCQETPKKPVEPEPSLSILDSIANNYGYENWSKVNTIRFTFNVERPDRSYNRSWTWDTREQQVTSINEGDTVSYLRTAVDSTLEVVDARFINDKYWLLVPFNLIWDQDNFEYEVQEGMAAPISQESLRKLTIVYGDSGGYTPGDAYDFYLTEDLKIKEWAWRPSNSEEARIATVWQDPQSIDGLLDLSLSHEGPEGSFKLFFTDVSID